MNEILQFAEDESGATAIEYALIALGIALGIIAAVSTAGSDLAAVFTTISAALK